MSAPQPESPDGARLPGFARDFPDDRQLAGLVRAFADGDYARVRRETPQLLKSTESEDVKSAAMELVRRTKADPLMVWLVALTGILLAALSAYWMARGSP